MSLLRPVSIFLRNALVKQHPYFSCCASCGEIKTPLGRRLCTSLSFHGRVDAVIVLAAVPDRSLKPLIDSLVKHCPWLDQIFVVADQPPQPGVPLADTMRTIPSSSFMPTGSLLGPEAFLHLIPGINDYYILPDPGVIPDQELLPLDFFTPNGIPLLRPRKDGDNMGNIRAQCRDNAVAFLRELSGQGEADRSRYWELYEDWALRTARAIPAVSL